MHIPESVARIARSCGWLIGSLIALQAVGASELAPRLAEGVFFVAIGLVICVSALALQRRPSLPRAAFTALFVVGVLWASDQVQNAFGLAFDSRGLPARLLVSAVLAACGIVLLVRIFTGLRSPELWTYVGSFLMLAAPISLLGGLRLASGPLHGLLLQVLIEQLPNQVLVLMPGVVVAGLIVTSVLDRAKGAQSATP